MHSAHHFSCILKQSTFCRKISLKSNLQMVAATMLDVKKLDGIQMAQTSVKVTDHIMRLLPYSLRHVSRNALLCTIGE